VIFDISDGKQLEIERKQLDCLRREFMSSVSEEFKTPLTSIRGFAETLLSSSFRDKNKARQFVQIIYESALRLSRLTDDLQELTNIESGQLALDIRRFSMAELVEHCLRQVRVRAKERHVNIEMHAEDDLLPVKADRNRLQEAISNILNNAVERTPSEGYIRIKLEGHQDFVRLAIADPGAGLNRQDMDRIFDRGLENTKPRSLRLGGLGLLIARRLVEAQGGRLVLRFAQDQEMTFLMEIPVAGSD
jgi:two-component system phosphate regulon sensor histidine kinase PhoR